MRIGYARDSLSAPILHTQIDKLKAAGCQKIFTSIKSVEKSNVINTIKVFIRVGEDTIVVCSFICLDKPLKELIDFFHQLNKLQLSFESIKDNLIIDKNKWAIAFSGIHLYQQLKNVKDEDD